MHSYLEMNLKKALSLKNSKRNTKHNNKPNQEALKTKLTVNKQVIMLARKQTQAYFKISII